MTEPTPTPGAMRAAEFLTREYRMLSRTVETVCRIARQIDRETALPALLAICRNAAESANEVVSGPARAALAKVGENP